MSKHLPVFNIRFSRKHYANFIFISLLSILIVSGCGEEKVKPKIDYTMEDENLPVQESWDSKIFFSENGKLKAVLYADHLMMYESPREKLLEGVEIEFYDEHGIKTSSLTSKRGRVDDITEDMFAIDSVVAINDSANIRLETEELMWRKIDRKIVSDKFVKIISEGEIIEGYGFESEQNLRDYVIFDITYQTTVKKNKK